MCVPPQSKVAVMCPTAVRGLEGTGRRAEAGGRRTEGLVPCAEKHASQVSPQQSESCGDSHGEPTS